MYVHIRLLNRVFLTYFEDYSHIEQIEDDKKAFRSNINRPLADSPCFIVNKFWERLSVHVQRDSAETLYKDPPL